MVKGLNLFKEHFSHFSENYVLIGGAACTVALEKDRDGFRNTRDLDIVLCVEALTEKFVQAFWEFIHKGKYECRQRSTGKKLFYRFHSPGDLAYPEMLELFSRKPDALSLKAGSHLTPIPVSDEVSSLSAILLNDEYYRFIHEGKQTIEGLPIVVPTHLIPLKARAWVDLSSQAAAGVAIDEKNIRKHRNDIIRLYQVLPEKMNTSLPKSIQQDMQAFLDGVEKFPVDVKQLGIDDKNFAQILALLKQIYGLTS